MGHKARPLEIVQLEAHLTAVFGDLLPPSTNTADLIAAQSDFNSRALAAHIVMKMTGCDAQTAASSLVDGKFDGGIDAIHLDNASQLWVVQSKWYRSGQGMPSQGDCEKFATGLGHLLKKDFSLVAGNPRFKPLIPKLEQLLEEYNQLKVRGLIVYTGDRPLGDLQTAPLDDLEALYAHESGYLELQEWPLSKLHGQLVEMAHLPGVSSLEIELQDVGQVERPYRVIYGRLRLADLAHMVAQHGESLIAANIRSYKGNTPVNSRLLKTLEEEPELFFYLNNGLVAYCDRFSLRNETLAKTIAHKRLRAQNFCIINGAQTAWAIAEYARSAPGVELNGYVFLRLVSLDRVLNNLSLAQAVTESSNFQNAVGLQDLAALRPEQERIAAHLRWSGVRYHAKVGVDTPKPDSSNFTIEEAVTALACLSGRIELTCLILRDVQSLFSIDPFREAADPNNPTADRVTNYGLVFAPTHSARDVWRAVQIQRCVVTRCDENERQSSDQRQSDLYRYGRWFILQVILAANRSTWLDVEDLTLTSAEEAVVRQAVDVVGVHLEKELRLLDDQFQLTFGDARVCQGFVRSSILALSALVQAQADA